MGSFWTEMPRCRRRWKQWTCLLVVAVVVFNVLYGSVINNAGQDSQGERRSGSFGLSLMLPRHQAAGEGEAAAAGAGVGPGAGAGGQQSRRVITLYDPTSPKDLGDRVGLRGLHRFDCVRAIEGFPASGSDDQKQLRAKAAAGAAASPPVLSEKAFMERLGDDCGALVERHGYNRYPAVTAEERAFPIAFNVLLYKEVEQLHVLLRAMYRPHNAYCLHVDGHADPQVLEATRRLAACLPNVFLASRRENITYSGFSRLQADLNCMRDHWRRSTTTAAPEQQQSQSQSPPWRYLINLPSQDFPLKTNLELVKILKIYNGANDIEGITQKHRMLQQRFIFKHVYRPGPSGRLGLVKTKEKLGNPPHNITVVKGSAYGVFSRDFVRYVLEDPRARALLDWCRAVDSPDEYFWATLNHNNPHLQVPGAYSGVPDDKPWLAVYASWPPRDLCGSGKAVRGVCIFGLRDLPQLVDRHEMFANKFYMNFEPQALHCLDQWLFNKTWAALPLSEALYYRKLPFIKKP